jgi:hypothetical protein
MASDVQQTVKCAARGSRARGRHFDDVMIMTMGDLTSS